MSNTLPPQFFDADGVEYEVVPAATMDDHVIIKPKVQQPKRWRAEKYEKYWFVTSEGHVDTDEEYAYPIDDRRYKLGNYFPDEKTASVVAEGIKAYFEWIHSAPDGEDIDHPVMPTEAYKKAWRAVQGSQS
jgi:hypothetical protein